MAEVGFRNLSQLRAWLAHTSIRFLKSEILNRPSKIFQTRIVELSGPQKTVYDEIRKMTRDEIESETSDAVSLTTMATKTLRLRQILNNPSIIPGIKHYNGDSAKYQELDLIVEDILSNEDSQLLVWTQWRDSVDTLVQRYKGKAIAFYGGSDDKKVREAVLSKKAKIVIAIPEKAGTSIDWLKQIRTAVYLEKPWYLSLYRQSLDRIDRRTNTDPALIISIEVAGSVDQMVNAVLHRRQEIFDALTLSDDKLVALNKTDLLKYLM